jgi:ubiquinone biosynthesis protein
LPEDFLNTDLAGPRPVPGRAAPRPVVVARRSRRRSIARVILSGEGRHSQRIPNPPVRVSNLRAAKETRSLSSSAGDSFRLNRVAAGIYRSLPKKFYLTLWRRLEIIGAAAYYFGGSWLIWLLNLTRIRVADKHHRNLKNGARLRKIVEWLGGGFIKVGQQLALRSDLLPGEFCDELDKLYDRSPAIPFTKAIKAIDAQLGCGHKEVFREIDPNAVGSASLACVYSAILMNGDRVAIKVKRPGIEALFGADIAAVESVAWLLELLTIYRQNFFQNVVAELKNIALEETDFQLEARYQELFRKYLGKNKALQVTAPRVYFEYSGPDVLVAEFVSGIRLTEILGAIDKGDARFIEMLEGLSIRPSTIAKNLIRSKYYSFHECPFFHGDPHPGNILVQPHNHIVMLDFGACGVFSEKDRRLMLRMSELYGRGDVAGMVDCVLGLLEPLPMVDVDCFKAELLDEWWKGYYGLKSDHAQWWERTSLRLWLALLKLFNKYQISMPTNMIRMVRATLLYDTVAAQLYPKINVFTEFGVYYRRAGEAARRQFLCCAARTAMMGPPPSFFQRLQSMSKLANDFLFRAEQFLGTSEFGFMAVMNKLFFAISGFVNLALVATQVALVAAVVYVAGHLFRSTVFSMNKTSTANWSWSPNPLNWTIGTRMLMGLAFAVLALNVFSYCRQLMSRWRDRDNYSDRTGIAV